MDTVTTMIATALPIVVGIVAAVLRAARSLTYWGAAVVIVAGVVTVVAASTTVEFDAAFAEFLLVLAWPVVAAFWLVRRIGARVRIAWSTSIGTVSFLVAVIIGFTLGMNLGVLQK